MREVDRACIDAVAAFLHQNGYPVEDDLVRKALEIARRTVAGAAPVALGRDDEEDGAALSDRAFVEWIDAKNETLADCGAKRAIRRICRIASITPEPARAETAGGWRSDMDAAPRDGTEVLLRVKVRAGVPGKMLVGHYMPGGHCIEDHPPIEKGWYFWNGCSFDLASVPTHWMPLPPAPGATPAGTEATWQAERERCAKLCDAEEARCKTERFACLRSKPDDCGYWLWAEQTASRLAAALRAQPAPIAPEPEAEAARDVLAERRRQVEAEGWTPEHDDVHSNGELVRAAICYADAANGCTNHPPSRWPWDRLWWKPGPYRRSLVKAGALILAEIERLDRAAARVRSKGGQG